MKVKRFSIVFVFMLILNTLAAPFAFAETPASDPKLKIVALGDSITFGYPPPSTTGFPDLITGAGEVVKFGKSGATSTELLAAISTDPNFSSAIQNADVITLNIGSNDLMQATGISTLFNSLTPILPDLQVALATGGALPPQLNALLAGPPPVTAPTPQQLDSYKNNLVAIITSIKQQTDAPIIIYTLYNPIVISNHPIHGTALNTFLTPLHTFVEENVTSVNDLVIKPIGAATGSQVVDAYSTIKDNPSAYVIPFDIHPTPAGHEALALLADGKIKSIIKPEIVLSASTVEDTTAPVNISVTNGEHIVEMKWLRGVKTAVDFETEGTAIENNTFSVTENDTYTVYVKNIVGNTAVATIEVKNIKPVVEEPKQEPKVEPTPQQPTTQQPTTTQPTTPKTTKVATVTSTGNRLPNTATPMYNYLAYGFALVLAGLVAFKLQSGRKNKNQSI